ncbi:MAG: hypothetical protein WD334_10530 [Chitinophagales bacterium]
MNESLHAFYEKRQKDFQKQLNQVSKRLNILAFVRILVFIAGAVICFQYYDTQPYIAYGSLALAIIIFLVLVKRHDKIKAEKEHLEFLVEVNKEEIGALIGDLRPFANGEAYQEAEHPYAFDLDILGDESIFQNINRTGSYLGGARLAEFLKDPVYQKDRILLRQKAIDELKDKIDWRQTFQAHGKKYTEDKKAKQQILDWLEEAPLFAGKKWMKGILIISPIIAILLIVLASIDIVSVNAAFLYCLGQLAFVGLNTKRINQQHNKLSQRIKLFKKYAELLKLIEAEDFKSPQLLALKSQLESSGKPASEILNELSAVLDRLESRSNVVAAFVFNGLFLRDLRSIIALEEWKQKYQFEFANWFDLIADFEAFSSMANYAYNHPKFIFPEISEKPCYFVAKELGHPLLDDHSRVCNDFSIVKAGQISLVTGANMAGKSTYLRTVGVNLVLGMSGSVVCAEKMEFSPMELYTSMRTNDSLIKHASFFYAELSKLKTIVDELAGGKVIFVLLDEILKGTNSKDQHTGSEALIEQIIRNNGSGLIATHDVSLGDLEQKYPENLKNQCFEIEIEDGEMIFDYKVKDGVNQNLNATFLMKQMGITV